MTDATMSVTQKDGSDAGALGETEWILQRERKSSRNRILVQQTLEVIKEVQQLSYAQAVANDEASSKARVHRMLFEDLDPGYRQA